MGSGVPSMTQEYQKVFDALKRQFALTPASAIRVPRLIKLPYHGCTAQLSIAQNGENACLNARISTRSGRNGRSYPLKELERSALTDYLSQENAPGEMWLAILDRAAQFRHVPVFVNAGWKIAVLAALILILAAGVPLGMHYRTVLFPMAGVVLAAGGFGILLGGKKTIPAAALLAAGMVVLIFGISVGRANLRDERYTARFGSVSEALNYRASGGRRYALLDLDSDLLRTGILPASLEARIPEELAAIFTVTHGRQQVWTYQNGDIGYQYTVTVQMISCVDGSVLGTSKAYGSQPPEAISNTFFGSPKEHYGSEVTNEEIADACEKLLDRYGVFM